MTRRVFNYGGGMHSPAALTQFIRDALDGEVANGMEVVAGSGMNVTVKSGTASVGKDPSYDINITGTESVSVGAASPSNPMNALIVAYVDRDVAGSTAVTDNTNDVFKLKAVSGAAAATPSDPTTSAIQAAIGAANPFIILARVRKQAGATSVTAGDIVDLRKMITLRSGRINDSNIIADGTIQSKNIDAATIIAHKEYNDITEISGVLTVQTGWTQFVGNNTINNKRFVTPIVFPKQYKKVCFVNCSFIGHKSGTPAKKITDFVNTVGEGNLIEPNNITNTGCDLVATSRGGMGAAWHGAMWMAVGVVKFEA